MALDNDICHLLDPRVGWKWERLLAPVRPGGRLEPINGRDDPAGRGLSRSCPHRRGWADQLTLGMKIEPAAAQALEYIFVVFHCTSRLHVTVHGLWGLFLRMKTIQALFWVLSDLPSLYLPGEKMEAEVSQSQTWFPSRWY